MIVCSSETHNDIPTCGILTTFHEIAHYVLQLQKSLRYNMYYYCNVLYYTEFRILLQRLPEDGRVPPKRAEVNKRLYYCICYMCMCWFYKRETDVGVPKISTEFTKFLCMGRNSDSDGTCGRNKNYPWTMASQISTYEVVLLLFLRDIAKNRFLYENFIFFARIEI